jgi:hypothetical protein
MANSFVLFPQNLPAAHDRASELFDENKAAILDRMTEAAYEPLLKAYRFERYGFTLIPPKTAAEIVAEGHALHHCVGAYAERVARGDCIVLFLRRAEKIDEPFYTVELRNGRIVQARGQNNSAPTPEVNRYLSLWEKKKLNAGGKKAA